MNENALRTWSLSGTILAASLVVGGLYWADVAAGGTGDGDEDPFANYTVIDAALAEKAAAPETKQPVKETRAPRPEEKPVGVSRDENAKPVTEPEKPKPDKPDIESILEKNRVKDEDEDLPVSREVKLETGRIDGVDVGYGDKTYGNPYLGALKSGILRRWEYPEILSDVGVPTGCFRIKLDGTIDEVKVMTPSGNAELDDSVERALTEFMKKNNEEPKPVPDELFGMTKRPLCFRMKV